MYKNKLLIFVILVFCFVISIGFVSASDNLTSQDNLTISDDFNSKENLNAIDDNTFENLSKSDDENSVEELSVSENDSSEVLTLNNDSSEVLALSTDSSDDVLSSSVTVSSKEPHTFYKNGYKFTVSASQYDKIKKAIKMGKKHDWLDNGFIFKVKTNKVHIYKKPIYKTKKVTKYKWAYKKISVSQQKYWDWELKFHLNKKTKGWQCYKLVETDFEDGIPYKHYVYLKKKVKYAATKKIKTGNYKNVKMRVYARISYQGWFEYNGGEHFYYPMVEFLAMKNGYSSKLLDIIALR